MRQVQQRQTEAPMRRLVEVDRGGVSEGQCVSVSKGAKRRSKARWGDLRGGEEETAAAASVGFRDANVKRRERERETGCGERLCGN